MAELTKEESLRVADAVFLGDTPLATAFKQYIRATVVHYMFESAADNGAASQQFNDMYGNFVGAAVAVAIEQVGERSIVPIQSYYTEAEACKFLRVGKQFLKTRRSKGQSVPQYIGDRNGYRYAVEDLLSFKKSIGPIREPISEAILIGNGIEELALSVATVKNKVDRICKKRVS